MGWKIDLSMANGTTDIAYCVSRAEARERRDFYLTMTDGPGQVVKATVRKV